MVGFCGVCYHQWVSGHLWEASGSLWKLLGASGILVWGSFGFLVGIRGFLVLESGAPSFGILVLESWFWQLVLRTGGVPP